MSTSHLNFTVNEKRCRFCMKHLKEFSIAGFVREFQSNYKFRFKFFYFVLTMLLTISLNVFIILKNQRKFKRLKCNGKFKRVSPLSVLDCKTNMSFTSNACVDLLTGLICMSFTYVAILFEYWPFTSESCILLSILTLSLGKSGT
jgi:hypothetical protein